MIALVVARTAGGTGRHVRAVAAALAAAGRDVVVAGPRSAEAAFRFGEVVRYEPVEVSTGPRPVADLRAVRRLRTVLRDAEVVHAHGIRAAALAGAALGRGDAAGRGGGAGRAVPRAVVARGAPPLVTTWHNALLGSPLRRAVWAPLERRVARRAAVTLCVSADLVERVRALGGGDVRLAPVGARRPAGPARPPGDVRAELGADGARPLVVAAGRVAEQKGYDLLLDAAAGYERRTPRPRTVVAGEGPLRDALSARARERGLDVAFVGHRADVAVLFAAADVVVLPSRWEGSPLSAHEALFSGTPLVATAVGGLPQLLAGGAAVLTPPGDAAAFAAAVTRLLDDPAYARETAAAGLARAEEWPDEEEAARRVLAVYDEVLTR